MLFIHWSVIAEPAHPTNGDVGFIEEKATAELLFFPPDFPLFIRRHEAFPPFYLRHCRLNIIALVANERTMARAGFPCSSPAEKSDNGGHSTGSGWLDRTDPAFYSTTVTSATSSGVINRDFFFGEYLLTVTCWILFGLRRIPWFLI